MVRLGSFNFTHNIFLSKNEQAKKDIMQKMLEKDGALTSERST